MTSGIYFIKNKINNKLYVGSSNDIHNRWWAHKKELTLEIHCNDHLQNSWLSYGEDAFEFIIEKEMNGATNEELKTVEQIYIDKYWDGGKNCYNISRKSDRPDAELNKIPIKQFNKETGEFIRDWPSAADVERELGYLQGCIANSCKGILIAYKGFKWKYADQELASQYKEKEGQHGGHNKKKVACINNATKEIIQTYNSLAEAEEDTGVIYTAIISVCSGKRAQTYGMSFAYYNDETKTIIDNQPEQTTNMNFICKICAFPTENAVSLARHLQRAHNKTTKDYSIEYLHGNVEPRCLECDGEVRYVSFTFKKYCKAHSHIASSLGGKVGGVIKKSWNKGKTKETDERIKIQAENMVGVNNHFYGKTHSKETIDKIQKSKFPNKV